MRWQQPETDPLDAARLGHADELVVKRFSDVDSERVATLNKLAGGRPCFVCGERFSPKHGSGVVESGALLVVCPSCGGPAKQRRFECMGFAELLERFGRRSELPAEPPADVFTAPPTPPPASPEPVWEELESVFIPEPKPQPEERVVSEETKPEATRSCPYCGKEQRVDNKRGACSRCLAQGRIVPGAGDAAAPEPRKPASQRAAKKPPATKAQGDIHGRFAAVIQAFGVDEQEILATLKAKWLQELKARLEP